jgi:hypothetical protein
MKKFIFFALCILCAGYIFPQTEKPYGFDYFVGIVGSPSDPDVSWSDEQLRQIKDLGVNTLQLSIAWGGKPANEVLNLEDLDSAQVAKWDFRIKQAKKFGFRVIAHFGIPKLLYTDNGYSIVQPACIMDPGVHKKYDELLGNFFKRFPSVDNILVYTYDQNAWLCSEFGPCPRCSGIPISDRLTSFLDFINSTVQKYNPGATFWWKPWEISNGSLVQILQDVNTKNFGLILNSSSSNEAYPFNDRAYASDLGIKRTTQVAADRNIPVIGEFDYTFYKGYYSIGDFFPRFVYEQLQEWKSIKGVIGIKEYFGFAPSQFSVNAAMLKACMKSPDASLEQLLNEVASAYGKAASPFMLNAWENVARGVEALPWDVTYLIGQLGIDRSSDASHPWDPVTINAGTWNTPAWETNRKGNFMLTDDSKAHPWLFEDVGLHLKDAADLLFKSVENFDKAIAAGSPKTDDIKMQRETIVKIARALRGKSLHFLETLAAQDARLVGYDKEQFAIVTARLQKLLEQDAENQGNTEEVVKKLNDFKKDPKAWLLSNLNPLAYETKCRVDWTKFIPYPGHQD